MTLGDGMDCGQSSISFSYMTDIGYGRASNEDNVCILGATLPEFHGSLESPVTVSRALGKLALVGVFDGMGGESNGEAASYTAAITFAGAAKANLQFDKATFSELFTEANKAVISRARELRSDMIGTTATVLLFFEDKVLVGNVGDSPGFLLRNGKLYQLTKPDTDAQMLASLGIMGRSPALTQYLGMGREGLVLQPHISWHDVQPGDAFLIASDGLTDEVSLGEIRAHLMDGLNSTNTVSLLIGAAKKKGARDNVTAIACMVKDQVDS